MNKAKNIHWKTQSPLLNELFLSIYFKSPAAYEMLRKSKVAKFPNPSTFRRKFRHVFSGPGICPKIMQLLRAKVETFDEKDCQVVISLDGMYIKEHIIFDKNSDTVLGCVDSKNHNGQVKP